MKNTHTLPIKAPWIYQATSEHLVLKVVQIPSSHLCGAPVGAGMQNPQGPVESTLSWSQLGFFFFGFWQHRWNQHNICSESYAYRCLLKMIFLEFILFLEAFFLGLSVSDIAE